MSDAQQSIPAPSFADQVFAAPATARPDLPPLPDSELSSIWEKPILDANGEVVGTEVVYNAHGRVEGRRVQAVKGRLMTTFTAKGFAAAGNIAGCTWTGCFIERLIAKS